MSKDSYPFLPLKRVYPKTVSSVLVSVKPMSMPPSTTTKRKPDFKEVKITLDMDSFIHPTVKIKIVDPIAEEVELLNHSWKNITTTDIVLMALEPDIFQHNLCTAINPLILNYYKGNVTLDEVVDKIANSKTGLSLIKEAVALRLTQLNRENWNYLRKHSPFNEILENDEISYHAFSESNKEGVTIINVAEYKPFTNFRGKKRQGEVKSQFFESNQGDSAKKADKLRMKKKFSKFGDLPHPE